MQNNFLKFWTSMIQNKSKARTSNILVNPGLTYQINPSRVSGPCYIRKLSKAMILAVMNEIYAIA